MLEHELNPAASKFISSLVKSLQLLCNGHVDYSESIELVGHINVRVDHQHKYDYIVDEQVSKEGNNSSTFLSNSYYSHPPTKSVPAVASQAESHTSQKQNLTADNPPSRSSHHTIRVNHRDGSRKQDNILVKMEGNDDDCMVLPASPEDYDPVDGEPEECGPLPGTSSAASESYEMGYDAPHTRQTGKKRKMEDRNSVTLSDAPTSDIRSNVESLNESKEKGLKQNDSSCKIDGVEKNIDLAKLTKETLAIPDSINCLKENITHIASMLNLQVVSNDAEDIFTMNTSAVDIKAIKKRFFENMDKEKIQKLKKLLKTKNGKRKKLEFKSLLSESGINEDLLKSLAHETSHQKRKFGVKDEFGRDNRKSLRLRTQERQQKLLEMAENLKRSKGYNASTIVVSKVGNKKISLHKSSISIFSHQTQFLTLENLDDAVDALTGRVNKYGRHCDKNKEKKAISTPKRQHLKRKMRQVVGRIIKEISEAGYRVTFSNTIGSDADSNCAELAVIPIKVDELYPEIKDDPKLEISEDDYAKHLEREHFLEKQKANEDKMKEFEVQLTQILSGVEDVLVSKRKRYGPGDAKPTDAERMKMYRKRLKEDPEKYQNCKQERSLTIRKKRLRAFATKLKTTSAPAMEASDVTEEDHNASNLSLPQTVSPGNIHCPQVYGHPSTHQAPAPAVNVHHSGQYVGQVPGMQTGHQHPQSLSYSGEMDIVELIAATHNVQNQHFG